MSPDQLLPSAYHANTPASNGTPYCVQDQEGVLDANGLCMVETEDQQPDEMLSSPAQDRMFLEQTSDVVHAHGTSTSWRQQDRGEEGLPPRSDAPAGQQTGVDMSRQSVMKRLAAKRAALSGSGSPALSVQSPSSLPRGESSVYFIHELHTKLRL